MPKKKTNGQSKQEAVVAEAVQAASNPSVPMAPEQEPSAGGPQAESRGFGRNGPQPKGWLRRGAI